MPLPLVHFMLLRSPALIFFHLCSVLKDYSPTFFYSMFIRALFHSMMPLSLQHMLSSSTMAYSTMSHNLLRLSLRPARGVLLIKIRSLASTSETARFKTHHLYFYHSFAPPHSHTCHHRTNSRHLKFKYSHYYYFDT